MMVWFNILREHIAQKYEQNDEFNVLEIGVYEAENTKQLLKHYPNMKLVSVDPFLHPNTKELMEKYEDRFTFIHDLSLNVLKDLYWFDVVLLDGDHNYFTVYNELKTIMENNVCFPLVILHDTNQPWGRVDGSYNPKTIPEDEFRGERQGVLSAVEDFIHEYTVENGKDRVLFKLTLYQIGPGLAVLEQVEWSDKIGNTRQCNVKKRGRV